MAHDVGLAHATLVGQRAKTVADALVVEDQRVTDAAVNSVLYDVPVQAFKVADQVIAEKVGLDLSPGETCQVALL